MEVAKVNQPIPLIIHDLQDSQMFSLAQAAGRAGIRVEGTCHPFEPWLKASQYIDRAVELTCLEYVTSSAYALNLRNSGLSGVWLPCSDDLVEFTARYRPLLEHMGMRFLSPNEEQYEMTQQYHLLPEVKGLEKTFGGDVQVSSLYENIDDLPYPLIIKAQRWKYHIIDNAADFLTFLDHHQGKEHQEDSLCLQSWIEGGIERMASAILLFDANGHVVRGFTGRRQRVAPTPDGTFGESTAVKAEWIPELYDGAVELLTAMKWQGFAEVECKQAPDGKWYVMEINPRLSGWACLAEVDGAGMLQAYYDMCAHGAVLEEACLQRSDSRYVRMITTCYHDPDWAVSTEENDTIWNRIKRIVYTLREYRKDPTRFSLGAWDGQDLRASLYLLRRTIRRVWAIYRGKSEIFD